MNGRDFFCCGLGSRSGGGIFRSVFSPSYYLEKYSCILQSGLLGNNMFIISKCAEPSIVTQLKYERHIYRRFDMLHWHELYVSLYQLQLSKLSNYMYFFPPKPRPSCVGCTIKSGVIRPQLKVAVGLFTPSLLGWFWNMMSTWLFSKFHSIRWAQVNHELLILAFVDSQLVLNTLTIPAPSVSHQYTFSYSHYPQTAPSPNRTMLPPQTPRDGPP